MLHRCPLVNMVKSIIYVENERHSVQTLLRISGERFVLNNNNNNRNPKDEWFLSNFLQLVTRI